MKSILHSMYNSQHFTAMYRCLIESYNEEFARSYNSTYYYHCAFNALKGNVYDSYGAS